VTAPAAILYRLPYFLSGSHPGHCEKPSISRTTFANHHIVAGIARPTGNVSRPIVGLAMPADGCYNRRDLTTFSDIYLDNCPNTNAPNKI